ncbi:class I SAM-dependent methyltransferase [Candidatus Bathyarchaeota archaeon]|nr:MAG: class I SAM-dependent methyltransferase [Candidatus Bathyarchaeota archaeon]
MQMTIVKFLSEFPYLCSPIQVIDKALEIADLSRNDIFADLGCGDGAVLLRAAERFRVFCVGFEINPILVQVARRRIESAGLQDLIDIVHSDLFLADLSRFSVIYIYPSPLVTKKLSRKISIECRKGTRVLVHDYPLRFLQPAKVVKLPGGPIHTHTLYLYKI